MSKCPVAKVSDYLFRFVKPVVDGEVVFDRAAPLVNAGKRMVIRMCHIVPLSSDLVRFGDDIPSVVLQPDRSAGNIEAEVAKATVVYFPAAVQFFKIAVAD